jgi:hypothetical protein
MTKYKGCVKAGLGIIGSTIAGAVIGSVCYGISGAIVWGIVGALEGMVRRTSTVEGFLVGVYIGAATGLFIGIPASLVLGIAFRMAIATRFFGNMVYKGDRVTSILVWGLVGIAVGAFAGIVGIMFEHEGTLLRAVDFSGWTQLEIQRLMLSTIHTAIGGGMGGVTLALIERRRRLGGKQKAAS